jgi:eukaryotic-like serine/threonine-protein kinase
VKDKDVDVGADSTRNFSDLNPIQDPLETCSMRSAQDESLDETIDSNTLVTGADANSSAVSCQGDPDATADHAGNLEVREVPGRANNALARELPREFIPGYRILGELGRGAMGVVFKAQQLQADRTVALKVMLDAERAGQEELARFQIEVQAAAKLQHPHIVQVYEVGTAGKMPYFTQEFLAGGTLSERIKNQLLSHRETAECMLQLSQAIGYAHSKGVVHRDLKPSNILLADDGALKVADFGLARRMEDQSQLTRDGAILGTPSYMAPEQASGSIHKIGPSCDIYALGAILYELLTGRPPFKGATVWEVVNLVRSAEPASPTSLRPDTPKDLETICLKCLEKEPEKRYTRAADLAEDLRRHLNHEPILARPIGIGERLVRLCKRYPRETALVGVLTGVLLVAAIGTTWAAVQMAQQRDQIAIEKDVSDQRLSLYKDSVSTFVNRTPQLLEGVPFAGGVRQELGSLVDELLSFADSSDPAIGPSQQWGMAGVAIRRGDMLVSQAEILGREDVERERIADLLAEAEVEFKQAEEISRRVLDSREGDRSKGLGNLALSYSRMAVAKRLAQDTQSAEALYRKAIELRQQALSEKDAEKSIGLRRAELGREYANLTELQLILFKESKEQSNAPAILDSALESSQKAVELLGQALNESSEEDPSPNMLRDFVLASELAATLALDKGEYEQADRFFSDGLAVARQIVDLDPWRLSHRVGLAKFAATYGDFWLVHGKDPNRAREHYVTNMLQLRQIFGNEDLHNLQENGLAMGYYRLGLASHGQGDPERARQYFERSELIRELDLRQRRDSAAARQNPDVILGPRIALMLTQARSGNWEPALEEANTLIERAESQEPILALTKADLFRHAAAALGIIAQQQEESQRSTLLDRAIETMRKAIDAGFDDREYLESDPDLLPLQDSENFADLLKANENSGAAQSPPK